MNFVEIFTVHINTELPITLNNDYGDTVVMIPFSGRVTGKYFTGKVLPGGIDIQIIGKYGDKHTLSARYMLDGMDYAGESCKIFIENNGSMSKKRNDVLFRTYPKIITDSIALGFLNHDLLVGEGIPTETGIDINIYRAV